MLKIISMVTEEERDSLVAAVKIRNLGEEPVKRVRAQAVLTHHKVDAPVVASSPEEYSGRLKPGASWTIRLRVRSDYRELGGAGGRGTEGLRLRAFVTPILGREQDLGEMRIPRKPGVPTPFRDITPFPGLETDPLVVVTYTPEDPEDRKSGPGLGHLDWGCTLMNSPGAARARCVLRDVLVAADGEAIFTGASRFELPAEAPTFVQGVGMWVSEDKLKGARLRFSLQLQAPAPALGDEASIIVGKGKGRK